MFKACIVQTGSHPYEKEENRNRILSRMESARKQGADLILFPEMYLTGYLIKDKLKELAEPLEGPSIQAIRKKAKEINMGVIFGLPLLGPGNEKPYNALVMIDRDGSIPGWAAKTHMFGGEEKMFQPGDSLRAFDTSFGRVGLMVCYDGEFPETARTLALDGAQILCMCAANMFPFVDYHAVYVRARAMENTVYGLYCNYIGTEKRFRYCGQSSAFHPNGKILAYAGTEEETELYFPVEINEIAEADAPLQYLKNRRGELYRV